MRARRDRSAGERTPSFLGPSTLAALMIPAARFRPTPRIPPTVCRTVKCFAAPLGASTYPIAVLVPSCVGIVFISCLICAFVDRTTLDASAAVSQWVHETPPEALCGPLAGFDSAPRPSATPRPSGAVRTPHIASPHKTVGMQPHPTATKGRESPAAPPSGTNQTHPSRRDPHRHQQMFHIPIRQQHRPERAKQPHPHLTIKHLQCFHQP